MVYPTDTYDAIPAMASGTCLDRAVDLVDRSAQLSMLEYRLSQLRNHWLRARGDATADHFPVQWRHADGSMSRPEPHMGQRHELSRLPRHSRALWHTARRAN